MPFHVNIKGQSVEVFVSDYGIFYSKDKKFQAASLQALQRKMEDVASPKAFIPIPCQHKYNKKMGKIEACYETSPNYISSVKVRWESGKTTKVPVSYLRRPCGPEAVAQRKALEEAADAAQVAADNAAEAVDAFDNSFDITPDLKMAFGAKKRFY